MSAESLFDRFLAEEADNYVIDSLLQAARRRTTGVEEFTFNVFDVRLDFDTRVATIADVLDVTSDQDVPLASLLDALEKIRARRPGVPPSPLPQQGPRDRQGPIAL